MVGYVRLALSALILEWVLAASSVQAAGPVPPCAPGQPIPQVPASAQQPPNIRVWFESDLPQGWRPAPCVAWKGSQVGALVATAGLIEESTGLNGFLERLGSISDYPQIRYWSVTRQRWRPLVEDAQALTGPDRDLPRGDFQPEELQQGTTHYFWQKENTPADEVLYQLRILERSPNQLVFALSNAKPIRRFLFEAFPTHAYQFLTFLQREEGDVWRYYNIMRSTSELPMSLDGHKASFINRAAALFRYFADIPTDQEPPLAPTD